MKALERQVRKFLSLLPPELETITKGLISYVPGIMKFSDLTHSSGAMYCYSTYLAHVYQAYKTGLAPFPRTVLELGPGSSFGVGLAALLCGADVYYAIDELPHARLDINLEVLDETIDLLRCRTDPTEERGTRKILDRFPVELLTDDVLNTALDSGRVERIRRVMTRSIQDGGEAIEGDIRMVYIHPFSGRTMLPEHSVDMIMSTVVLQVVENLPDIYSSFAYWLKPGGWMSHFIDFSNYGMTRDWNGHWACSSFVWRLMQGNRPYLHNRAPHSVHIQLMQQNGFEIISDVRTYNDTGISRKDLAREFQCLTDDDLRITRSLVQAVKS